MRASYAAICRRLLLVFLISSATLLGGSQLGSAADSTADAKQVVMDMGQDVWTLLHQNDSPNRVAHLITALEARTNVPLLSRLALGRYWRDLSEVQQADFPKLFSQVVIASLARRLDAYAGEANGRVEDQFQIIGGQPIGQGDILVRSKVILQSRPPIAFDWRLREVDGQPVIIDVVIEGVSLLITQRADFAAVIERRSLDDLLADLRAKADATQS